MEPPDAPPGCAAGSDAGAPAKVEIGGRSPVRILPMRREDLDAVMEIENRAHRSPWVREVFVEESHRAWAHIDVLRDSEGAGDGRVRAFVNYWLVGDEVHVLNVATDPDARRQGHASRLIEHVIAFATTHACSFITLEVRRANHGAIRLYRRHAFRPVGIRPHYYDDGEDAIVMILELEAKAGDAKR